MTISEQRHLKVWNEPLAPLTTKSYLLYGKSFEEAKSL